MIEFVFAVSAVAVGTAIGTVAGSWLKQVLRLEKR